MNIKSLTALAIIACSIHQAVAQTSFSNGVNSIEFSGLLSGIYKQRFLDASNPNNHIGNVISNPLNQKKNVFSLSTARFNIQGTKGTQWTYRMQLDLAQIGYTSGSGEFPALLDAWMAYKPIPSLKVTLGYQKVPYSANCNASLETQPYWQRAEITRGGIFSRRDMGITIKKSFVGERINVYGGVYSGLGEYIMTTTSGGDNDQNGKLEYMGRIDFSTAKLNYNDIYDVHNTQQPLLNIGLNARYVERSKSYNGLVDYDLKIVNGKKRTLGADLAFAYKGFSAQAEIHQLRVQPNGSDTSRLQGANTDHFNAGGMLVEVNYYNRKLKSGVYVRYDNFIPNDLIKDNQEQTLSFGYNYFLKGTKSMFKLQYLDRLDKKNTLLLRTNDEIRVGWQVAF